MLFGNYKKLNQKNQTSLAIKPKGIKIAFSTLGLTTSRICLPTGQPPCRQSLPQ